MLNYFSVRQYRNEPDQLPAVAEQVVKLGESQAANERVLSIAYSRARDYARVIAMGEAYQASHQGKDWPLYLSADLAIAYSRSGQLAKAQEMITYLAERAKVELEAAYRLARVFGELGRKDEAIVLLQKCFVARDDRMVWLKVEPNFESFRNDPRFQSLLQKMNL
jgi:hypothetical protein